MELSIELLGKIHILTMISNQYDNDVAIDHSSKALSEPFSDTLSNHVIDEYESLRASYLKSMDPRMARDVISIAYIGRDGLQGEEPEEAMRSVQNGIEPTVGMQIRQINSKLHLGEFLTKGVKLVESKD